MGLMQKACETYDSFKNIIGEKKEDSEPLAPISHILTTADIEITIDNRGNFKSAKDLKQDKEKIIIPVTEESAGRTRAACAHPLSDKLVYVADLNGKNKKEHSLYIEQLRDWVTSTWNHPKVQAILNYVEKNTIINDLVRSQIIDLKKIEDKKEEEKEKDKLIRWVVDGLGTNVNPCWTDTTLFDAFIGWYSEKRKQTLAQICMVSGQLKSVAKQHPKGIVSIHGNAKLISANDNSNFTYRGRFTNEGQALSISYEASQKAHCALRWLIANQGIQVNRNPKIKNSQHNCTFGGRTFLCWSPQGIETPTPTDFIGFVENSTPSVNPSDYKSNLKKRLLGYTTNIPQNSDVVLAVLDAATTGRLSLVYYNELSIQDYIEKLINWETSCCWYQTRYGIQSPLLFNIVKFAYGTPRNGDFRFDTRSNGILRQQMQRLFACKINGTPLPLDFMKRIVERTSRLNLINEKLRETILFTACAVIAKYHYDNTNQKDLWNMETSLETKNRSFQFGRILAILDDVENKYYFRSEKPGRETNASRMMFAFTQSPWTTYEKLYQKITSAYFSRLKPQTQYFYKKLLDEIVSIIYECNEPLNLPLKEVWLLGYQLQRQNLRKNKTNEEKNTTEE